MVRARVELGVECLFMGPPAETYLFHSLLVMNMSSRVTAPSAIFSSSARPTSSSFA